MASTSLALVFVIFCSTVTAAPWAAGSFWSRLQTDWASEADRLPVIRLKPNDYTLVLRDEDNEGHGLDKDIPHEPLGGSITEREQGGSQGQGQGHGNEVALVDPLHSGTRPEDRVLNSPVGGEDSVRHRRSIYTGPCALRALQVPRRRLAMYINGTYLDILAPDILHLNYCQGTCSGVLSPGTTHNLRFINIIRNLAEYQDVSPACCVPVQYSTNNLYVQLANGGTRRVELNDMKVEQCACR